MVFGSLFVIPPPAAHAALGLNSFEIGSDEPNGGNSAGIVGNDGGGDWASLAALSGDFDPGEVAVVNDQNFTGSAVVMNPETAADDFCTTDNDLIVKNGTKIDDYPFEVVAGSPSPGKNDICQVYVSYEFSGGDTILYAGVVRRETGGTTGVAIELNKVNHANRAVNDLLVMFEFDGSGPISSFTVRKWDGTTWVLQTVASSDWDGGSWEHFGEVAVNISAAGLLPPPTSVDDCDSFSTILPYGIAGNSANSNVGDWGGELAVEIPRCGQLEITKIADPAADNTVDFGWQVADNGSDPLDPASGTINHNETISLDLVAGEYTLTESVIPSPYELDRIECSNSQGSVSPDAIVVALGTSVSCTIYNVASSVQVVKTGDGDGSASFDFSATGQSPFQLSLGDSSEVFLYSPDSAVTITETLPGGQPSWDLTAISCTDGEGAAAPGLSIDLGAGSASFSTVAGELITCTFSNEQDSKITVVKNVVNDNGGTAAVGDFNLYLNGSPVTSGAANYVEPGTYTASEDQLPGYTFEGVSCVDDDTGSNVGHPVNLAAGQEVTCTLTNNDVAPKLTLEKFVINDDGGTAVDTDWTLHADGPVNIAGSEGEPAVTDADVEAGTYTLSESNGPSGYNFVSWDCGGHTMDDATTLTLGPGDDVTCTATNDDVAPRLTLVKILNSDDGGDATLDDFILSATGPDFISGVSGSAAVTNAPVEAGTYDLSESGPPGYVQVGDWSCLGGDQTDGDTVVLGVGESATCTVTNDDVPPRLIVIKTVVNDDGGDAAPGDFQLYVNGVAADQGLAVPGIVANVSYTVTEDQVPGYAFAGISCVDDDTALAVSHPVTLDEGQRVTCEVTNNDISPGLTVLKSVINNDGGNAVPGDFQLYVNGEAAAQGISLPGIEANTLYTVTEDLVDGYSFVGISCLDDSTQEVLGHPITLDEGQAATCTVFNDDVAPELTLVKSVVNDDGGDAVPGDFQLYLNGSPESQNVAIEVDANTLYTVTEDQLEGYELTGISCVDDDTQESLGHPVTLDEGQSATCTVTNDDVAPELTLVKSVVNDDGGDAVPGDFQLYLNGSPESQNLAIEVDANTLYTVTEDQLEGYSFVGISCLDDDSQQVLGHPVTLDEGQSATCTVYNDDIAPLLTLEKEVINDDGGTAVDTDWTLRADGPDSIEGVEGDASVTGAAVTAGTYDLTELNGPFGYNQIGWDCGAHEMDGPNTITLAVGEDVTCTVTNDDIAPRLTLEKSVINDDGGNAVDTDWTLHADGPESVAGAEGDAAITNAEVLAGSYDLSESGGPSGYFQTGDWVCDGGSMSDGDTVVIGVGEVVSCEVTNDDLAPGLTVVKEVINDDGGNALASDFQLYVNGEAVAQGIGLDVVSNVEYTVTEDQLPGYTLVGIACADAEGAVSHPVTLDEGQAVLCTVTNDDVAPELTLVKSVINDDGGDAVPGDFQLYLNGSPESQDVAIEVDANTLYTVTEDQLDGYELTGISCVDDDSQEALGHPVTLDEGQSATCTVTNDDLGATLTVVKEVIPVEAAMPDDFLLTVTPEGGDPISVLSGEANELPANATYTVDETLVDGFVQLELTCEDESGAVDHPVSLSLDQHVTCTITNAQSPTVTVVKVTEPESDALFSFTLDPGDTQDVPGNGGSYTWEDLEPGDYSLTEATPVDWSLESYQCDVEFEDLGNGAGFNLDWGDHVMCVFSNGELGSITVVKETDIETSELFDISIDSELVAETVQLGDGDSYTWAPLPPGSYEVNEVIANLEWNIGLSCEGGSAAAEIGPEVVSANGKSRAASIDLGFGDHVICTFTNEAAEADLEIVKVDLVDPIVLSEDEPVAEIEYQVTVTNNGPGVAYDVVVTDTLPGSVTFVSAESEQGTCAHAAGFVVCSLGTMEVGDVVVIDIVVQTEEFGEITDFDPDNLVVVESSTKDPNPENNVDDEKTDIEEILDVEVLPFTGISITNLPALAVALIAAGLALVLASLRRKDRDQPTYPG